MAEAGAPAACPTCSSALARVFSAPPRALDAVRRTAGDVHERSAHAPERVSGASIGSGGHHHGHGHGPSRPWQLSH